MIVENHQIAYKNVASKYYNFVPAEIDLAIQDFDAILSGHGYHSVGKMFFSILSNPTAEVMTAKLFIPIEEYDFTIPKEEEINFNSYFLIDRMIMTRITDDFDARSQATFSELLTYIEAHEMSRKTPMFVEFKETNAGKTNVEMSVGVSVLFEI
ncbi:DUF5085 family protein [Sporosarcina sp. JAI121]|uniref:DUF5085 family protein n=1 Tax=Sporosarcina sp. JAI121 TaxID=2723064 RepID=UPI0015C81307|nr:DUF5085 family protein [Sporosarcina sp. JAI121]NYF23600.1 hypothetical protein [Sporosarcina sp. JAI121]